MNLSLARALRMDSASCVAFAGAGGKTTAMVKLARELGSNVIVTATTHLGKWQTEFADKHIITEANSLEEIEKGFQGIFLITGRLDGERTKPISNELLRWLYGHCKKHSIPLLIEADGSRQKPLKGWAEYEPPIPEFADLVVQVIGMSGIGKTLSDEYIHRPEIFSKLSGLKQGERIGADAIIRVLTHPKGGLKNIPKDTRRVVLLNQADTPEFQSAAQAMKSPLLRAYHAVIVASLASKNIYAVHEPIAGIVLAAGGSTRFGKPKQLLDWKGQPFVRAVSETAIRAGLSPIVVVTGANAEQVEAAISDLDVIFVRNADWQSGQGSSIREAVKSLTDTQVGGAVFLLSDQPQVSTAVIRALREKHTEELSSIVAPMVIDRRGNPVLFDRVTFPDLMTIEGDTGGRAIFHKYRVEYLPWHDDSLLLDVDTPEQYERLISNGDL